MFIASWSLGLENPHFVRGVVYIVEVEGLKLLRILRWESKFDELAACLGQGPDKFQCRGIGTVATGMHSLQLIAVTI